MRSPSQPKITPPAAAPTRKPAVTAPNQNPMIDSSLVFNKSRSAERPTSEKTPISMPSNIQPSSAPNRTNHWPREIRCIEGSSGAVETFGSAASPLRDGVTCVAAWIVSVSRAAILSKDPILSESLDGGHAAPERRANLVFTASLLQGPPKDFVMCSLRNDAHPVHVAEYDVARVDV